MTRDVKIALSDTTTNGVGVGTSVRSTTRYYLSKDQTFGTGDVYIGYRQVPVLASGQSHAGTATSQPVPTNATGSYYLIACADEKNELWSIAPDGTHTVLITSAGYEGKPLDGPNDVWVRPDGGLYITDLIGFGVNGVTGDYSRGASGFWIENGKKAYPVSGITVAGNLKDMFKRLTPANDLELRYGVDAPTVRIDGLTLAGT